MNRRRFFFTLCGMSLLVSAALGEDQNKKSANDRPRFELFDGDRVVFLGNTLIEREQKYGYWETMLTARYPDRNVIFRNLGWDGDTVWAESRGIFDPPEKGYQRMLQHVGRIKPTVIFLGYGNNEAFAGPKGLPAFIKQYNKLLDDLKKVSAEGVRFVLIAPVQFMSLGKPLPDMSSHNRVVLQYAAASKRIAEKRGYPSLDFNVHVSIAQSAYDQARLGKLDVDPAVFLNGWTRNSIHWRDLAYRAFASSIGVGLMDMHGHCAVVADADGSLSAAEGVVARVSRDGNHLNIELTPTEYSSEIIFAVKDLSPGTWELRYHGKTLHSANVSRKFWSGTVRTGPHVDRFEELRQAVIEKNLLYFHSWRPQNVTYLFLFRKHEQGRNAREVEEFRKLVTEKEQEIARLKKPLAHTYELNRVKEKEN